MAKSKLSFQYVIFFLVGIICSQVFQAHAQTCETFQSNKDAVGEASIVYFHMGDDQWTSLAQETVDLSKAFSGADYKVLLIDENESPGTKILKSKALAQADEVLLPTQSNFLEVIQEVADAGYVLNIWIFAHGSEYTDASGNLISYFTAYDGSITSKEIKTALEKSSTCDDLPIRMVYTIACYQSGMNDEWRNLGAKIVSGAKYINFYPTQYGPFANAWNTGKNYNTALTNSNTAASRTIVQSYIAALSLGYSNQGECSFIPNVLGKTDCAEWYFTEGGPYALEEGEYNPSYSGTWNMNNASTKIVSGDKTVTKTKSLTWNLAY